MNGGMQRCFNMLHQLTLHFKLTAIIHQEKENFLQSIKDYPAIASAKIYSTKNNDTKDLLNLIPARVENALRSRWYQRKWNSPADSSLIKYYPILIQLLKRQKFDVIILENLATLNAVRIIRRFDKKVKIIYDAHNVDSNLEKAALNRNETSYKQFKSILNRERNLKEMVNGIITCSENDKQRFEQLNSGKLVVEVVPNGIAIPETRFDAGVKKDQPEYILFCGTLCSIPNVEGLDWFCKSIWPLILQQFPNLKLLIIGGGKLPEKYRAIKATRNIEFTGSVQDVKKWYNYATISVVPLLTGSGTRLKILEAMAMGVPVVSTEIGAEGICYNNQIDIIIADEEKEFAEKVIQLLKNQKLRIEIAQHARELVKKQYDWNIIGLQMRKVLTLLTNNKEGAKNIYE